MESLRTYGLVAYFGVALALAAALPALRQLSAERTGVERLVYADVGFRGEPLRHDITRTLTLAFLGTHAEMQRRYFSVRWRGYWFLPRARTVDLLAGADDAVDVWLDGRLVHRRGSSTGMHTARKTIALEAGLHELLVEYEQHGGRFSLNLLWAPKGGQPRALPPDQLFPALPSSEDIRLSRAAAWLERAAIVVWAAPLMALLTIAGRKQWSVAPDLLRSAAASVLGSKSG